MSVASVVLAVLLLTSLQPVAFGAGGIGGVDESSSGGGGGGGGSGKGPDIDANWVPYGFAMPEDPQYRFIWPDNNTRDLLGLAAKGNVVLGDYTNPDFQTLVAPKLKPGADSVTQPYAIDPSDAALGYESYLLNGKPYFNGDYTQVDEQGSGKKLDGTPRKFYESTLPDAEFKALVDPQMMDPNGGSGRAWISAVLYTNHAITGLVKAYDLSIYGSLVGRDDGFVYGKRLWLDHDIRLFQPPSRVIDLPGAVSRPRLVGLRECPQEGC